MAIHSSGRNVTSIYLLSKEFRKYGQDEEWYEGYEDVRNYILEACPPTQQNLRILNIGCGTSDMSELMHLEDKYQDILNVDCSQTAIEMMQGKYRHLYPHIRFQVGDALNMSKELENQYPFDMVIDKGTLDSIQCAGKEVGHQYMKEIDKILIDEKNERSGVFINVTFSRPDLRVPYFYPNKMNPYQWTSLNYFPLFGDQGVQSQDKKKDSISQSQRESQQQQQQPVFQILKDKDQADQQQKYLLQRLYAKYSDSGFIIPNKLVAPPGQGQILQSRRTLPGEEQASIMMGKKSNSVLRKTPTGGLLTPLANDNSRNPQMRAKFPMVQSRRHLDISQTPLPTLPFPRVLGKDVISPFPGSQDHLALKRIIAQHQSQVNIILDSQTLSNSQSQQLLGTYRPQQPQLQTLNTSQSYANLKADRGRGHSLIQSQSMNLLSPADKTLAILESHSKLNNKGIQQQSYNQLVPLQANQTIDLDSTQQIALRHPKDINLQQISQQLQTNTSSQQKETMAIQAVHGKKKEKSDIKEYMEKQGMKPSPLEFIKLVQLDAKFANRFCYCNKSGEFYDFQIVPFTEKDNSEYMTVSQRGIVHFVKGEANFLSIPEWEREQRIFKQIQRISFFEKYRTWKTFSAWKTLMRRTMIFKTSDFLNRELFILDSEISKPLLDIRMKTYNIQKMQMVAMTTERPRDMIEFYDAQERQRKSVQDTLNKIEKEIKSLLVESCDKSMRTFKEDNRISLNDNQDDEDNEEAEPFLVGDETHKQMPYTQEATTRTHYKKLAKYIRLTDYMMIDAKLKLITNSINNVHKIVNLDLTKGMKFQIGDKYQQTPLFEIQVNFRGNEIFFNPNRNDIKESIKTSVTEGVNTVCRYELFSTQPEFEIYMNAQEQEDHLFDEQNDLMSLAIGSDILVKDTESIGQSIDQVYQEILDFSKQYEYFVNIYIENSTMDIEEFRRRDHEYIHLHVTKWQQQQEEIDRLDVRASIKIVKLDAQDMRNKIRSSPTKCWDIVREQIPRFQYEKLDVLYQLLDIEYKKVSRVSKTVDEFVIIQGDLKELSERFDTITEKFQEIEQYNILIDEHRIKMPEKNKKKFKEVYTLLVSTRKKMEEGLENGEVEELRFKKELIDHEIPKMESDSKALKELLDNPMFSDVNTSIVDAVPVLEEFQKKVQALKERGYLLNKYQKFLELEETPFESVDQVYSDFNLKYKLWNGMKEWINLQRDWVNTQFSEINVDEIQKQVDNYDKISLMCSVNLKDNPVTQVFKERVDELKSTMPVVTYLRDDSLKERHWVEIFEIIQKQQADLEESDFKLKNLIEMNVKKHKDKLGEIALKAMKEQELEETFKKVVDQWKKQSIEVKPHKDQYSILGANEELYVLLEESMVTLSNVLGARFVDHIRNEVDKFYKNLGYIENLLNEWQNCQKSWMYLENIFNGSPDMVRTMGQDAKKFQQVDLMWKEIMKWVASSQGALKLLQKFRDQDLLEIFRNNNRLLDEIQKVLEQLLEKKRTEFARFYFVSNDELLQILADCSKHVHKIKPHLRKLFENINSVDFDLDDISKLISAEGEIIKFKKNVKTNQVSTEKWLSELEDSMRKAVAKFIKTGIDAFKDDEEFKRHLWVLEDHPAQAISVVGSIQWCNSTEFALKIGEDEEVRDQLRYWYEENVTQLEELTKIVSRQDIVPKKRKAVVALITQDVHYRDIIDELVKDDITSMHDFKWQQQLRYYYMNEKNTINIKQISAELEYGNEYLGATTRLVITPLTDRCWMTITGALHIKLGAAPAGPAGTGKTESTKDLAKSLGKFCVVFNCSDQINYKMMEQLFSGLAWTGSWACLDEFNRIDIEVLSVIAQQILTIRNAMLANDDSFNLGDRVIGKFLRTMGIFITMNPGYKGRTELPDNLKVLFRPVSMMIPDYALIAEIMLFAEGFVYAKSLSRKMTKLYKLASEQLSQQCHYDFGMRAVKSVLVMAGQVKRNNPKMAEDIVLIRAMRDSNIPKFIKEDLPLFNAIIKDLFPGIVVPEPQYELLKDAIHAVQEKEGLTPDEQQTEKIIQFYETMNVRFGLMIIGQTLSGKTTVIKTLKNALRHIKANGYQGDEYLSAESETLNPKSITMDELYGSYSVLTQEWTDGLASTLIRNFVSKQTPEMKWVIFDGPVDAIWIENMNTVLDDNMTLCLSCGERIKLRPEMRMLFEVDDLSQASPATVSRCGMVFASPSALPWRPIAFSWIKKLPEELLSQAQKTQLQSLFEIHIDNTIELIRVKQFKEPIPTVDNNFIISMCRLLQSILENGIDLKQYKDDRLKKALTKIFIYSLAWSFGSSIDSAHHSSFEVYLGTVFNISDLPKTSIFDNQLNPGEIMDYTPWTTNMPKFEYRKDKSFFELVVPTKDTVRFSWLLRMQILNGNPVFLTGITGVGKSIIASSTLEEMKKNLNYDTIMLSFSSQTQSKETQNQIEEKLEKRRRNLLAGMNGRKVILFIDDVNMPAYDNYGTQMPIELLRQYLDFKGLYDRSELHWKNIQDTTLICAAAPPEGGRKVLSKRFTRHFHMICLPPTQEESLQMIFQSIVDGFFQDFKKEIQSLAKPMVDSSLLIFNKITKELRPTPAKSHYTFNLRDISKVFQGICMAKTQTLNRTDKMVKLWIHEACRVFHDRLINNEDKKWFTSLIADLAKTVFRQDWNHSDLFEGKPLIFGDFMKRGIPFEERQYDDIKDINQMSQCILDYLEEYNIDHVNKLDLVLFPECLQHISRICRILRQPRGNALMVGVGGSGKQTLTRLSTFIADCDFATLEVKKNFNQNEFRENLKKAMLPSGIQNKRTAFLINDNQITSESFLEDINNLLNSGEIPNLWLPEDKELISKDLKPIANEKGIYENFQGFFLQRMRDSLHIVLCLSPVGESFRQRVRMFPSLVNCCAINWVNSWPEEALLSVSMRFIQKMSFIKDEQLKKKIAQMCVIVHQSVDEETQVFYDSLKRRVYITPKSYLDLIKSYQVFLDEKHKMLSNRRNTLFTGLTKLEETNSEVSKLSDDLTKLQPFLEQSMIEAEQMRQKLEKDKQQANKVKMQVEDEKIKVDKQAADVNAQFEIAMKELNEVLPILKSAEEALNTLNNQSIAEIRGTVSPSAGTEATIKSVYMLLEKKENPSKIVWKDCQKMMSVGFFEKLKTFQKDEVKPSLVQALDKFKADTPTYNKESAEKAGVACFSLFLWSTAIVNYAKVAKVVEPKKQLVDSKRKELEKAQADLNAKTEKLNEEMRKVEELEKAFQEIKEQKEKLENDMELCRVRLVRAEKLTTGLSSEHGRWKENVGLLDAKIIQLVGDVFIAAACASYYGPFTGVFREKLVAKWMEKIKEAEIPVSERFNMSEVMGDPMEIQSWNMNTLPSDQVSISNGILVKYGTRRPLMIDPQQQATKWIKTMYSDENILVMKEQKDIQEVGTLKSIRYGAKDMIKTMENCIKQGYQLLIEDMGEQIEPAFEPVLLNQIFITQHGREQINFENTIIDYDRKFKLYMTTKMPNPHYLPEMFIRVTVINFTVTLEGLEQQLLAEIVKLENPAIEQKKIDLTKAIVKDQQKMKQIEDTILYQLVNATGNILDEEDLINYLDRAKNISREIKHAMEENEIAQVEIEIARNQYQTVSERGSILYFVIADLSGIDPMYQYSLSYFLRLFNLIIQTSKKSDDIQIRIETLLKEITRIVYNNICRGLFNTHKLIFAFMIAIRISLQSKDISFDEFNLFLKGVIMDGKIKQIKNPDQSQISDKSWRFILNLECTHINFEGLPENIANDFTTSWKEWITDKDVQNIPLPGEWETKLTRFQKMLVYKAFRDEKLVFKMRQFVEHELGHSFAHPMPVLMEEVFNDSDNKIPIIFVLSTGAEPTAQFLRLVKKIKGEGLDNYHIISLGQGQDKSALHYIELAKQTGAWVLLQNCHLYKSFMPRLEKEVLDIQETTTATNTINESFRLFLTSMPCDYFPVPILQNGIKLTNEPPKGIKSNIIGSLSQLTEDKISISKRENEYKTLIYSVCFFHAAIQERRKFGPLGWNIRYEFNESDFETALTVMKGMLSDDSESIVWQALQNVTGDIVYGGRVTDDIDRRTLMMILSQFISPDVLDEGFKYSPSGVYTPMVGENITLEQLINKAKALPDVDNPEIFGMNDNADIAFQLQESTSMIDIVLSVQPRTQAVGVGGKNPDQIIEELATKIESELPEALTKEGAQKELFIQTKDLLLPSLTTFLLQEMERFNKLIVIIARSLDTLKKAIKGFAVMGDDMDRMYKSMMNNKVPELWAFHAYPSLKPLSSWIENLKQRIEFLRMWLMKGKPAAYWLPAFFFPQGYLTALLQNYARKYQIAIDALNFAFQFQHFYTIDQVNTSPGDGVFFYGLFLESGRIDEESLLLDDARPGQKFSQVPMILFKPEKDHKVRSRDYMCPVYKTSERAGTLSTTGHSTNFVIMVEVPSYLEPKHWVLRGTAMFCQLDD